MTTVSAISQQIWDMKYRFKLSAGETFNRTANDTWRRVAAALAAPEYASVRDHWAAKFEAVITDFQFFQAGRIIAGAGTERDVTLFN